MLCMRCGETLAPAWEQLNLTGERKETIVCNSSHNMVDQPARVMGRNSLGRIKTMIRTIIQIVIGLLGLVTMQAALAGGESTYEECVLDSLRGSRNQAASNLMQRSCYALYQNGEMLMPRERAYHYCILQNLPGAKEPSAIAQISVLCSRRRQM
jgi:hypothetical protein